MGSDSDPPKNPFVRWKQHVDTHVAATLNNLLGIPSIVTKNLNIRRLDGDAGPSEGRPSRDTALASTSASAAPSPPLPAGSPADASSSYPPPSDDNNALDGVDANQLLEWHKFAYYSAYSPLRLQQQQRLYGLPPPIPRDVPFGADPYAFTYADAFEDLLRASSGRPLLDLSIRSYRNLQHQMRYGTAAEPPYVFFHRLHTQRLLDAYFPRATLPASASAVADSSGTSRLGAVTADTPNDSAIHAAVEEALAQRTGDIWRETDAEAESREMEHYRTNDEGGSSGSQNDGSAPRYPARPPFSGQGSLFDELDRVFRVLGQIVDEDTSGAKPASSESGDEDRSRPQQWPRVEDDLYKMVRSAYADAEKSLSTFIKTFVGDGPQASSAAGSGATSEKDASTAPVMTRSTSTDDQGYETIQTTDEHVDAFGNRHVKTVVRRLDADGNEVARETRYTVRSSSTLTAKRDENGETGGTESGDATTPAAKEGDQSGSTKSGWFWK